MDAVALAGEPDDVDDEREGDGGGVADEQAEEEGTAPLVERRAAESDSFVTCASDGRKSPRPSVMMQNDMASATMLRGAIAALPSTHTAKTCALSGSRT